MLINCVAGDQTGLCIDYSSPQLICNMLSIIEEHMDKGHIQAKLVGENPGYWTAPIISAYSPPRHLQGLQEPGKAVRRPLAAHQP
jgi:hypothetical protein